MDIEILHSKRNIPEDKVLDKEGLEKKEEEERMDEISRVVDFPYIK